MSKFEFEFPYQKEQNLYDLVRLSKEYTLVKFGRFDIKFSLMMWHWSNIKAIYFHRCLLFSPCSHGLFCQKFNHKKGHFMS